MGFESHFGVEMRRTDNGWRDSMQLVDYAVGIGLFDAEQQRFQTWNGMKYGESR
jgi:hypothetical protein